MESLLSKNKGGSPLPIAELDRLFKRTFTAVVVCTTLAATLVIGVVIYEAEKPADLEIVDVSTVLVSSCKIQAQEITIKIRTDLYGEKLIKLRTCDPPAEGE